MNETEDQAIQAAADDLAMDISMQCGQLADRILGRPGPGTPEWVAAHTLRNTPEGRRELQAWHLVKIRIRTAVDINPTGDVVNAALLGASWEEIGSACGISGAAARSRWTANVDFSRGLAGGTEGEDLG